MPLLRDTIWTYACVFAGWIILSPVTQGDTLSQHQAHEHGVGQLNVVVERTTVEIELTAPAADIVGFEHRPSTSQERLAVEKGVAAFKAVDRLFSFPPNVPCKLQDVDVRSPLTAADHREHQSAASAGENQDHAKHSDKESGENHDHAQHSDKETEESHADFRAHYKLECKRINQLNFIDVHYFEVFPAARKIEAKTISSRGQGHRELTPGSNRLEI